MEYQFTILGCGSSGGVPRIDGNWGKACPSEPKNRRTRASLLVQKIQKMEAIEAVENIKHIENTEHSPKNLLTKNLLTTNLLIDTSPDLRQQILSAGISHIDAVLYTHDHADQTHGIDDLRPFYLLGGKPIEIYADEACLESLQQRFGYCFVEKSSGYPPILLKHLIERPFPRAVEIKGAGGAMSFTVFLQNHGRIKSLGLLFDVKNKKIAYSSDVSDLPEESQELLKNIDIWIVDALRYKPHPTHFHLSKAISFIEKLGVKEAILTNLHIDMDYQTLCHTLPENIRPAYDGQNFVI